MPRRLAVPQLFIGDIPLAPAQAHHARDVLRLRAGQQVELFSPAGQTALATLVQISPSAVVARVEAISQSPPPFDLTIASAIPKGPRADWMIEKLSELGVVRFVPLLTQRGIVRPEGANKLARWERIAAEASRQSGRSDILQIASPTPLADFLHHCPPGRAAYLSTEPTAIPLTDWRAAEETGGQGDNETRGNEKRESTPDPVSQDSAPPSPSPIGNPQSEISGLTTQDSGLASQSAIPNPKSEILLIGPEGGWSLNELILFSDRHLTGLSLGRTILRVETAAIAAAAVVAAIRPGGRRR